MSHRAACIVAPRKSHLQKRPALACGYKQSPSQPSGGLLAQPPHAASRWCPAGDAQRESGKGQIQSVAGEPFTRLWQLISCKSNCQEQPPPRLGQARTPAAAHSGSWSQLPNAAECNSLTQLTAVPAAHTSCLILSALPARGQSGSAQISDP